MDRSSQESWGFPKVDDPAPPGTRLGDVGKVIYVLLKGHLDSYDAFDEVISIVKPKIAKNGTALVEDWLIKTPEEETFFPIFFNGDVEGWRRQIERGAKQLGLRVARIEGSDLIPAEGSPRRLSDCAVTRGGSSFQWPAH